MKKFFKILFCLFLVAAISVSMIACGNKDNSGTGNNPGGGDSGTVTPGGDDPVVDTNDGSVVVPEEDKTYTPPKAGELNELYINEAGDFVGGRHIRERKGNTQYDFILNSASTYVGVLPAAPHNDTTSAFSEFNTLLKEATGLSMAKLSDTAVPAGQKYISFGRTEQYKKAVADGLINEPGDGKNDQPGEKPLRGNGFMIVTVGENIYIVGGQDIGNVFGVYQLCNILFNFTQYTVDIHYIDKDVKNLKLPDVYYVEDPDIGERVANWGNIYYNATGAHRLGYRCQYSEILVSDYHTATRFLPATEYEAEHPEWYNAGQTQLCYTAHGDRESYNEMVEEMSRVMWELLKVEPSKNNITLTQADISTWCSCDDMTPDDDLEACKTTIADYCGSHMSTQLFFANDVAERIEKYRQEEQPDRPAIIVHVFAYHMTIAAPVEPEKVNGQWVPADGSRGKAVGHENLSVYMAIYGTQNYQLPLEHVDNTGALHVIEQYTTLANHVSFWPYTSYFDNFMVPFDSFTANQNHYKYYAAANAEILFNQGQHNNNEATGFSNLKGFLFGRWGWDVNLDYNTLTDAYFKNVFGSSNGAMRRMYEEIRTYNAWRLHKGLVGKSIYNSGIGANTFPTQMLFQWMDYVEQARKEIEPIKDVDYEKWEMMNKAITIESLLPRYFLAKYHINLFPMEERADFRRAFKDDCTYTGLNRENEGTLILNAAESW